MVNKRFSYIESITNKLCVCRHNMPPVTLTLTFDHLTLKVVSESHVTWATSVPILVFLGLSVLDLGPMYLTDRQTDRQIASLLNVPAYGAGTSCRREAATIYPRPCTPCCGPAPAHTRVTPGLRHPARLASSSCGRHIYARCTRQTSSSDVRQHHCLMLPPRGRGITRLNKYG